MEFTGERFVPAAISGEIAVEHFQRYRAMRGLVQGRRVLDLACGEGYGSAILAETAQQVLGVDIDADTVAAAQQRYVAENLQYRRGSATEIPLPDHSVEVVISFETIEHINGEQQQQFLAEVRRVLVPEGLFVVSTPDRKIYSDDRQYHNHFHVKEFYRQEFADFLTGYFSQVQFLQQGTVVPAASRIGVITNGLKVPERVDGALAPVDAPLLYLLAFCTNAAELPVDIEDFCGVYVPPVDRSVSTDLFFDRGQGFSHGDKLMQSVEAADGVYTIAYEIANPAGDIHRLRFDPVEGKACRFQLERMETNVERAALEYPETVRDEAGSYCFITLDPGLILTGRFPERVSLRLVYRMQLLDMTDFVRSFGWSARNYPQMEQEKAQAVQWGEKLDGELKEAGRQLQSQQQEIASLKQKLRDQYILLDGRDRMIRERERVLAEITSSHAWRLVQQLWRLRDHTIPMNSKRRIIAKLVYKTLRNPGMMFGKLNMDNVRKLAHYMSTESPADLEQRMDLHIPTPQSMSDKLKLFPVEDVLRESLEAYDKLTFPVYEQADVSIVIPVYNQFGFTYNCLRAILQNTQGVSYEVIIGDDGSKDYTRELEKVTENVQVLHHKKNLGFLRNCNAAAAKARGRYVLFLNNDTQVQPDWLEPMVSLLEQHEDIGMTGSKLVYSSGQLQEAGGITWKDASGWNYGHLDKPEAVQYNYVKDVDYISGASILIRRSLWEQLGGFDKRFAPAYYEDADLAFAVRKAGYRVVYQPKSVVVHFEGISNGTDLSSGVKKHQALNQETFYKKWQDVLEREQFPNGQDVFQARDRSRGRKTIVVVDHYVPHYDCDAGGRTTFHYLNFFVQLGFHVVFVGDNYFPHEPYTSELQQLGIEVLAGDGWSFAAFEKWLDKYHSYIDFVYLNRPHISIKYIDMVREKTAAKIIYYGHDLHFIREQRQYEVEKKPELLVSAKKWKKIECELFEKADVIHTPGAKEKEILQEMYPEKPIRALPIYLYDREKLQEMERPKIAGRKDLLFVGGFNHQPNADAVEWFMADIFPRILAKKPELRLYIVGSHPTEQIRALSSEQVIVTGYVSDEELAEYYRIARVGVVPLRYGAGIKGKIVESMYFGLPTVTTPIGAEGLLGVESCLSVVPVGASEEYAAAVLRLLDEDGFWQEQSGREVEYIQENFTTARAKEILLQDFK